TQLSNRRRKLSKDEVVLKHNGSDRKISDVMKIETIDAFSFLVEQNEIQGRCRHITPEKYEITLIVKENQKQTHPVHHILKETNRDPTLNEPVMTLETQLQISKGE